MMKIIMKKNEKHEFFFWNIFCRETNTYEE